MLSSGEKMSIGAFLFVAIIGIAALGGWCANIYKFATCDFKQPYK